MMRTLYLHVGVHRTATSSIQNFLQVNFGNLLTRGYLVPYGQGRHRQLIIDLMSGAVSVRFAAADIDERADRHIHSIHSLVISDEDISSYEDLSTLARFREYFDVKIVCSLRRQDVWLESWYLQHIKWQWNPFYSNLTFPEFMEQRRDFFWVDYDPFLRHLEGLFGRENILPCVFEPSRMPGGPIATFLGQIGIGDMTGLTETPAINESCSPIVSELMRRLPLGMANVELRAKLEAAFLRLDTTLVKTEAERRKLLLPHAERVTLLKEYAASNRAVAERYFARQELFSDPLPPVDAPVAEMRLPDDSETLMRRFIEPYFATLIEQDNQQVTKTK